MAELLEKFGVLPGDYFRRPPGERAVTCALMFYLKRRKEDA